MGSLYEINKNIDELLNSDYQAEEEIVNNETGEIDSFENILDQLEIDFKDKIDNVACFIKNLESDIDALKAEEKNLAERRKVKENKAERLRKYLAENLQNAGYQKFESPRCMLSFRKSKQVSIEQGAVLPEQYITVKTTEQPDKKAIMDALKSGEIIDGCSIVENSNLQIK